MQLKTFRVTNFRNILDSGDVEVASITALVGQNECGKSNLLQALNSLNPYEPEKLELFQDWPIDRWDEKDKKAVVCAARFDLDKEEIEEIWKDALVVAEGALRDPPPSAATVTISRSYENVLAIDWGPLNERLDCDKATAILTPRIPKCVLINEVQVFEGKHPNFSDLHARAKEKAHKLLPSEKTLMIALDLAALDLGEIVGADVPTRTFTTEAASKQLNRVFEDKWSQKKVRFNIRTDGTWISIFVSDDGLDALVPLERRSAGFQWFVSFFWRFIHASKGEFKNCILLIDEPGVRLHHAGHADLLDTFQRLSSTNRIIYTTHLATMIDLGMPERIRIMEVQSHHAKVVNSVVSSQHEPMMVIEAALGLSGAMSGLLGARQNLVLEGVDDVIVLQKLSGALRAAGEAGLSERIYMIPARSASKTPLYAAFLAGHGWDSGVILDSDGAGDEAMKTLKEQRVAEIAVSKGGKFRLMQLGSLLGIQGREFAIEDLFPVSFYLDCVNAAYSTNLQETDLPTEGSMQVVKRVEACLQKRGRIAAEIDKRIVMRQMLHRFDAMPTARELPSDTAAYARTLVEKINEHFAAN